jgi:hypothetical protein
MFDDAYGVNITFPFGARTPLEYAVLGRPAHGAAFEYAFVTVLKTPTFAVVYGTKRTRPSGNKTPPENFAAVVSPGVEAVANVFVNGLKIPTF